MTNEQPEQWARKLFHQVHRAYVGEAVTDHQVGVAAAALTLQRAFAEREAELVGALENIREATSAEDDAGENYRWDDREGALDYAYAEADRALKSREAGHG